MKKKIILTKEQKLRLNLSNSKKILVSEQQLAMLTDRLLDGSNSRVITAESLLGHPIAGSGKQEEYAPQTEKENTETTKSFNEGIITEGGIVFSLLEFGGEVIEVIKSFLSDETYNGLSPFWREMGVTRADLFNMMLDMGLLVFAGERLIVNRKKLAKGIRRLYQTFKTKAKEFTEPEKDIPMNEPIEEAGDPTEENPNLDTPTLPSTDEFNLIYKNNEIAVLENNKGELFNFWFSEVNKEEFAPYAERNKTFVGKDSDGDADFDYDDFDGDITSTIIENYINDNETPYLEKLEEENIAEILSYYPEDETLKSIISPEINEFTGAAGSSGAYVKPLVDESDDDVRDELKQDNRVIKSFFGNDVDSLLAKYENQLTPQGQTSSDEKYAVIINIDGVKKLIINANHRILNTVIPNDSPLLAESKIQTGTGPLKKKKDGTYAKINKTEAKYVVADNKQRNCGTCKHMTENKCDIVKGAVDKTMVCGGYEKKGETNEFTGAGSSGAYETPNMWAKDKSNMRFAKKPMYPGGTMVETARIKLTKAQINLLKENNLLDPAYPGGGFVEFDDCTKLNNNKVAQNGGCGVGDDGVVKITKKKSE